MNRLNLFIFLCYNSFGDNMNLYDKDLYATEDKFHIKHGSFYITKEQIDILNRYDIDINSYSDINSLLFDIEEYLNDSDAEVPDLEWVSEALSEYNYYNNTNK